MTNQPKWKLVANLGDASPLEYGGYFVYVDETGVYAPEAELLLEPTEDGPQTYTVYRFSLDRCKTVEDSETHKAYLVPFSYAPDWPHAVSQYDEWFHARLADVAEAMGQTFEELRAEFCSEDAVTRANAYRSIGDYHGLENLDSSPLTLTRAEAEERYEGQR